MEKKKKSVPYESAEELLQAVKQHGNYVTNGFVERRIGICGLGQVIVLYQYEYDIIQFEDLFFTYRWPDGSPCGKEVEV